MTFNTLIKVRTPSANTVTAAVTMQSSAQHNYAEGETDIAIPFVCPSVRLFVRHSHKRWYCGKTTETDHRVISDI